MKLIKILSAFALMLFLNAGALTAQSLADLNGHTWKENAQAVDVIRVAQKNLYSNHVEPTSIIPLEVSAFEVELYKGVMNRLLNNQTVADAIWESYSETVQAQVDSKVSEDEQKQAFGHIVELLKK